MHTRIIIFIIVIAVLVIGISVWLGFFGDIGSQKHQFVFMEDPHQYKFWQADKTFEHNLHYTRVLFSYSDDYGKTFSEPVDMSMTETNAHEPRMIRMHDDVILVWRDEVPHNSTLSFAKSIDYGRTFEKKSMFYGARPDIKYYDDMLYLTFTRLETEPGPSIWYSVSNDGGATFSEPKMIFTVDWELNPYVPRPTPTLDVDADKMTITWSTDDNDGKRTTWVATDEGKDGSFDVRKSVEEK